jgi:hypothetical protein
MNFITTTLGGMPVIANLPASYPMSSTFYYSSLGTHALFLLFFVFGFGFSLYRTIKKLKNPKFSENEEEDEAPEEEKNNEKEGGE